MRTSSTAQAVTLPIRESGIAWKSDVDKKFSEYNVTHFNDDHDTRGGGTITGVNSIHCSTSLNFLDNNSNARRVTTKSLVGQLWPLKITIKKLAAHST